MKEQGVTNFVFSSSATVYGPPQRLPLDENHPIGQGITNPYGQTKFFVERILQDLCKAEKVCILGDCSFVSQRSIAAPDFPFSARIGTLDPMACKPSDYGGPVLRMGRLLPIGGTCAFIGNHLFFISGMEYSDLALFQSGWRTSVRNDRRGSKRDTQ